ncbi:acyltransferase family protein [Niabella sp. CJ426]|uniref:acyltransferase family protein n=1 Tax=Niabella sp. CJ426 TaxID=3393740 RepID=UPI003D05D42E
MFSFFVFLLLASFLVPYTTATAPFVDPLIVILYFPLIVALGAGISLKGRAKKICEFSGAISYPLYMVHYPILWLLLSYLEKHPLSMDQMWVVIPIGTVLLIVFAYIIMIGLDIPIRKYLRRKID